MKKLLIISMLAIAVLIAGDRQTVDAVWGEDQIVWTVQNDGTNYWLNGAIKLPEGTDSFYLELPLNPYATISNGSGVESRIDFSAGLSDVIESLLFEDWLGPKLYEYYDISVIAFDGELNDDALARQITTYATEVQIIVQLTTDGTFDYTDMLAYYTSDASITFYQEPPEWRQTYFIKDTADRLRSGYESVPAGVSSIVIDYFDGNASSLGINEDNRLRLLDGITFIDTFYFDEYTRGDSELMILPFDDYSPDVPDEFVVYIYRGTDNITMPLIDMLNRNFEYTFDAELTAINYYSEGSLLSTDVIVKNSIPSAPSDPTPPTDYEFEGWRLPNGQFYDFAGPIPESQIRGASVRLTAIYRAVGAAGTYTTTDPLADTDNDLYVLLNGVGFTTAAERATFVTVALVILTIILFAVQVPPFAIMTVDIVILAMFMTFGLLSAFAVVVLMVVLLSGAAITYTRGARYE